MTEDQRSKILSITFVTFIFSAKTGSNIDNTFCGVDVLPGRDEPESTPVAQPDAMIAMSRVGVALQYFPYALFGKISTPR